MMMEGRETREERLACRNIAEVEGALLVFGSMSCLVL